VKLSGAGGPVSAGAGATGAGVDGSAGNGADGTDAGGFVDDSVGDSAGRVLG